MTNEYRLRSLKAMVGQLLPAFNFDDVHRRVLHEAIAHYGLDALNAEDWDAIISCEMIGIHETRPESYLTAAKWLQLEPSKSMMVARDNFHLNAAREWDYKTAFVKRPAEWGPVRRARPIRRPTRRTT